MKKEVFYRGLESSFSESALSWRMVTPVVSTTLFTQLSVWFLIFFLWLDVFEYHILFTYIKAFFSAADHIIYFTVKDTQVPLYASQVNEHLTTYIVPNSELGNKFWKSIDFSFGVYLLFPFVFMSFVEHNSKKWLRGSKLISAGKLRKELKGETADLPFGNIKLPKEFECWNVFFIGSPESGKTVFLNQVIERTIQRKENCVIYDFKGDLISRFFRPGKDILFNPLDSRCVGWNIFNEIKTENDMDAVAVSLIPTASEENVLRNEGARVIFKSILIYLFKQGKTTNADVWDGVTMDIRKLLKILGESKTKGVESALIALYGTSSQQAASVRSVLMEYVNSFQYLKDLDGGFSIKKWIEKPEGNIFIPNYVNTKNALKPILSLFIGLLSHHILLLPDDTNRRIFFFADEFESLQRTSIVSDLLSRGQYKGASVWLGAQNIGELEKNYGRQSRQIMKSCGTRVVFCVSDPATSQYLSDEIGQCVRSVPQKSFSMSLTDFWNGGNSSKAEKKEPLISSSDIQNLAALNAFVKFSGHDWVKVKLKYKKFKNKNAAFEERPGYTLQQPETDDQGALAAKAEIAPMKNAELVKLDPEILKPAVDDIALDSPESATALKKQESEVESDQEKVETEKKRKAQEQESRIKEEVPELKLSEIFY